MAPWLLTWQAAFSRALGQTERANQLLQESLGLLRRSELEGQDTRAEEAFALLEMGQIAHILGNRADANMVAALKNARMFLDETIKVDGNDWANNGPIMALRGDKRAFGSFQPFAHCSIEV